VSIPPAAVTRREAIGGISAVVLSAVALRAGASPATHAIEIEEVSWEVRPGFTLRQLAYGGRIPGPLLRFREGEAVVMRVKNATATPQSVHWHGLSLPPSVDGVIELGTRVVAPGDERMYRFVVPRQPGTRWYHSHMPPVLFSGMFGPMIVDSKDEAGDYDREIVLMIHEFGESIPTRGSMVDERPPDSPSLTAPARSVGSAGMVMPTNPNLLMRDAQYRSHAINGKALGAGDPIRVRHYERVRFRVVNASATKTHRLALAGHRFRVTHLDGNPVPNAIALDAIELGPGERVDAIVEMRNPGIWIFGSTVRETRENGTGIVIAYDGASGRPRWQDGRDTPFAYASFAAAVMPYAVERRFDLVLRKAASAPDAWSINDKIFPNDTLKIALQLDKRYLLRLRNESTMEHPMHLHGNNFYMVATDGQTIGALAKDTVTIRPYGSADLLIDSSEAAGRGSYLFHCHNEQHLLGGMAAIISYD
jgi:FtsP/CotA-like multicopper oxidase with cupredoxin domain